MSHTVLNEQINQCIMIHVEIIIHILINWSQTIHLKIILVDRLYGSV